MQFEQKISNQRKSINSPKDKTKKCKTIKKINLSGLWVWSPLRESIKGNQSVFLPLSFCLPLHLSDINKHVPGEDKKKKFKLKTESSAPLILVLTINVLVAEVLLTHFHKSSNKEFLSFKHIKVI